jgi:hypothetical protein
MSEPMKPGNDKGQIYTPMATVNIGKQNSPKTHVYKGMPSSKGGGDIKGPGTKNSWKK